jgi:hypothetical protein
MKERSHSWNGLLLIGILFMILVSAKVQNLTGDEKIWESFKRLSPG